MIYSYESSGEIFTSGESEVVSEYYSWESAGYTICSGDSENTITGYKEIAIGNIVIYGDSFESNAYKPNGGINLNGFATSKCRPTYFGNGITTLSNSSSVNYNIDFSYAFTYQVFDNFETSHTFSYVVGDLPFYVFRVTGKEYYNCDYIPFCAIPNGLNRMFQEIVARNLKEVCQFLSDVNWTWPIATIQRSLHPVESFFAVGNTGIALNGSPVPTSNEFIEIPFSQIPECLLFTVVPTPIVQMGIKSELIEANVFVATGGTSIFGSVLIKQSHTGAGVIYITGESDSKSNYFAYESNGSINISAESEVVFSYRSHEASGFLIIDGSNLSISPSYYYAGNGNANASGDAQDRLKISYQGSGIVNVYGDAVYPILQSSEGLIQFSGSAISSTPFLWQYGDGSLYLNSESLVLSPYYSYLPSGNIIVDNSIKVIKASFAATSDVSTAISISSTAPTRNSINGDFWYTTILAPITLNDSALYNKYGYKYNSSGLVQMFGLADSPLLWASDVTMGIAVDIDQFEVIFSQETSQQLTLTTTNIDTSCGICNSIPSILYLQHNLQLATVLKDFFNINGFSLDENIPLYYNKRTEAWQTSFHYKGIGTSNTEEIWQINIDWSCVNYLAEDQLGNSLWRFALYVNRVDADSNNDLDTRLIMFFPSETICEYASRYGLNFTFNVHLRDNFVTNVFNISVDNFTINDSIGLFNGTYWNTNTLTFTVSNAAVVRDVTTYDISFVRPQVPSQFYF